MMKAVLFDLDGTLADTAYDLGDALNRLLAEHDLPPRSMEEIRPVASHGSRGLIQLGLGIGPDDPRRPELIERFLAHYSEVYTNNRILFDGVVPLIEAITERGMDWGIITNKPGKYTDPLVELLPFPSKPKVVVSADTVGVAKPDPKPMLYALEKVGCKGTEAIYLGDAERDIMAGNRVQMKTGIAAYGYIAETDRPEEWGADFSIDTPLALLDYLR
jgi:phosphoglycolate phosphatase